MANKNGLRLENHNYAVPNRQSAGSFAESSSGLDAREIAQNFLLLSKRNRAIIPVGNLKVGPFMKEKPDVLQGTLALMVLKTLDVLGPQHGYGIARRIEQISRDVLSVNQGTLYPLLLKLEHEGSIASEWAHRKTTAAPASIALPRRAENSCRQRPGTGSKRRRSSHDSSR